MPMNDEHDDWLDALAGRRDDDPLTSALGQYVRERDRAVSHLQSELGFRRLIRRLDNEQLLQGVSHPVPLRGRNWLASAGFVALLMVSLTMSLQGPWQPPGEAASAPEMAFAVDGAYDVVAKSRPATVASEHRQTPAADRTLLRTETAQEDIPPEVASSATAAIAGSVAPNRAVPLPQSAPEAKPAQCSVNGEHASVVVSDATMAEMTTFYQFVSNHGNLQFQVKDGRAEIGFDQYGATVLELLLKSQFDIECSLHNASLLRMSFPLPEGASPRE